MKNFVKLFGCVAFAAALIAGMAACGGDGGDGGPPPAGDGSVSFSEPANYDVMDGDGTARTYDKCVSFFKNESKELNTVFAGSSYTASLSSENKFTLRLGTPAAGVLYPPSDIGPVFEYTSGLQIFELSGFRQGSKPAPSIYYGQQDKVVLFIYANQDGTVTGTDNTFAGGGSTLILNLILKQGWNTALASLGKTYTVVTGAPTSSYKWRTEIDD